MSLKIMLIEDDSSILLLLNQYLKEMGYSVYSFASAEEASRFCRCLNGDSCADIIITDNHMPGMSGLEFIEEIRRRGCNIESKHISIASGNWSIEEFEKAMAIGCKVLQKPYHLKEVRYWVEQCRQSVKPPMADEREPLKA